MKCCKADVPAYQAGKKKKEVAKEADTSPEERDTAGLFEKLTEASSTLMDAGELDVYSTSKEVQFLRTCDYVNFKGCNNAEIHHSDMILSANKGQS